MAHGSRSRAETAATAALVAVAAVLLPAWQRVAPADVAARLALGVAWTGLWLLACLGAGRAAVRRLAAAVPAPLGLELAAGAAALSLAATLLAAAHLLHPAALWAVGATAAALGVGALREGVDGPWGARPSAGWLLLAVPAAVQLLGVTAPPVFYDALNYHLAFPERWLAAGGWVEFPRHAYSYFAAACGSLYLYPLAAVGGWGARAVHLALAWTAALAAGELGRRLGGARAAWWAAALFALTPSALRTGAFPAADLGVAAWAGAAILVAVDGERFPRAGIRGALAGALAGTAVAAKYVAAATGAVPALLALALAGPRRRWPAVAAFALAAAAVVSPWLVRNALWTSDPVYPFLAPLFGLPAQGISVAGMVAQDAAGLPSSLPRWAAAMAALPVRTLHPLQVGGLLGPQWLLLLLPAALLVREGAGPLWAAAAAGLLGWGATVQFGRFLLPALVPGAALAGAAAARIVGPRRGAVGVAAGSLLGLVLAWNGAAALDPLGAERVAVVAGAEREVAFLARWVSYWPAVEPVRRLVPPGGRVLLVGEARAWGIPRRVVVEDPYRTPLLVELAATSRSSAELVTRLRRLGVTHLLLNRAEMARIARMRGLPGYFAEASPEARRRLEAALAALPVVWARGGLELRALPRR